MNKQEEINRHIGKNISNKRKELKLSQSSLANILGISTNLVVQYEKGKERVPADIIFKMADALRMEIKEITANCSSISSLNDDEIFSSQVHCNEQGLRLIKYINLLPTQTTKNAIEAMLAELVKLVSIFNTKEDIRKSDSKH